MRKPIYMDHHATTPVDPRVVDRMLPYFTEIYGNAASTHHSYGWRAEEAIEAARYQVAVAMGATARELVFTSGATESNNLAVRGVARAYGTSRNVILTQATEHPSVLDPCLQLRQHGFEVKVLPVDAQGRLDLDQFENALNERTLLVSVMWMNNEVGTVQPLMEIGRRCKAQGALFHVDATQGLGRAPLSVDVIGADLVSVSAHKVYGPKGVGALYLRRRRPRVQVVPIFTGGGQERGIRSGTINVPGVVGFGQACALAIEGMAEEAARVTHLRDRLEAALTGALEGVVVHGARSERHPGNLSVSFRGVDAERLMLGLSAVVAVSSGAACSSASRKPSHVLTAMGVSPALAKSSLRFGLGRFTTDAEVDAVASAVIEQVRALRAMDTVEPTEVRGAA